MAIQTKSLAAAEHDFWATRSGLPANAPMREHKRVYIKSQTGVTSHNHIVLERAYLKFLTSSTSNELQTLWEKAVAQQSLPVSKNINENRRQFFVNNTES